MCISGPLKNRGGASLQRASSHLARAVFRESASFLTDVGRRTTRAGTREWGVATWGTGPGPAGWAKQRLGGRRARKISHCCPLPIALRAAEAAGKFAWVLLASSRLGSISQAGIVRDGGKIDEHVRVPSVSKFTLRMSARARVNRRVRIADNDLPVVRRVIANERAQSVNCCVADRHRSRAGPCSRQRANEARAIAIGLGSQRRGFRGAVAATPAAPRKSRGNGPNCANGAAASPGPRESSGFS